MERVPNVPEVRFAGFADEWQQKKLVDVTAEFKSGVFIPTTEISISGLYPVFGGNGIRGYASKYNHYGEFALIGRQGALCGNMNYSTGKAYFTEHAVAVQANKSNNTRFLYYLLDIMNLGQYSAQSAQPGLAVNKIVSLQIDLPSLEEQQRIGAFLKRLDTLINLRQQKQDALTNFKKSMLGKMFPRPGASVSEVRFAGFEGEWKKKKLAPLIHSYSGGTPPANVSEYYGGSIPFIRSGEIHGNSTELFLTELGFNNSSAAMVDKGDILYALYGATSGEVAISRIKGAINQAILAIKPCAKLDALFLVHWFRNQKANIVNTYLQGGQGNLSAALIKEFVIDVPILEEQQRIGAFFQSLDARIAQGGQELAELRHLKSAFLEKMFV